MELLLMVKIYQSDYYYDIVRKNINKYRKEKGHTLQSLSEAADMSIDYLAKIVKKIPTIK